MKEITGAKRGENDIVLLESESQEKIGNIFSGRGVFSLDRPFNG